MTSSENLYVCWYDPETGESKGASMNTEQLIRNAQTTNLVATEPCRMCDGKGRSNNDICPACVGTGELVFTISLDTLIKAITEQVYPEAA